MKRYRLYLGSVQARFRLNAVSVLVQAGCRLSVSSVQARSNNFFLYRLNLLSWLDDEEGASNTTHTVISNVRW